MTVYMNFDFEEDAAEVQKDKSSNQDSLSVLSDMGHQLLEMSRQIEYHEAEIRAIKEQRQILETIRIPDLMDSLKLSEFKLKDGSKITSGPFVRASLPKDEENKNFALTWLRNNGHEDLIKREVSVPFDRGMDDVANQLVEFVKKLGMTPEDKAAIHHSTYTAFIKSLMQNGENVPFERLGAFVGRKAKVTPPRTK